jgi:hypothetical protein
MARMSKYSNDDGSQVVPRNGGVMENPSLTGQAGEPGLEAFISLFLSVENDRITVAKYHAVGCGPTISCGLVEAYQRSLSLGPLSRSQCHCNRLHELARYEPSELILFSHNATGSVCPRLVL